MGQCTSEEQETRRSNDRMVFKPSAEDNSIKQQHSVKGWGSSEDRTGRESYKAAKRMLNDYLNENVDASQQSAPKSPKSPNSEPRLLAVSSSFSHSFRSVCQEVVDALDKSGDGAVSPWELQLMVKHLDAQWSRTPVDQVPMSDPTIVHLTGKSKEEIASYIEMAYDEDWTRVFHQFLGLGATNTFAKMVPGVFKVVWPGGIRLRHSPNQTDCLTDIVQFSSQLLVSRFDYSDDQREFAYVHELEAWLPSRFRAGEPLIQRVGDLPEQLVVRSPVVSLRETTNWSAEAAIQEEELAEEEQAKKEEGLGRSENTKRQQHRAVDSSDEDMGSAAQDWWKIKQQATALAAMPAEEQAAALHAMGAKDSAAVLGVMTPAERAAAIASMPEEQPKQESEQKGTAAAQQATDAPSTSTNEQLEELLQEAEQQLTAAAETDPSLKVHLQQDLKELQKKIVLNNYDHYMFMGMKQFMRKAGVPRTDVAACLGKYELWQLAQQHGCMLPSEAVLCY